MRKRFKMTKDQHNKILEACKPTVMIALQCGPIQSPQEKANFAWCSLGNELGFNGMTVKPDGSNPLCFTAELVENND